MIDFGRKMCDMMMRPRKTGTTLASFNFEG